MPRPTTPPGIVSPQPGALLDATGIRRPAPISVVRTTSIDTGAEALNQLARLLGRAAALDHHRRRRRGYSIWEVALPLGIIGLLLELLFSGLGVR